MRGAGSVGFGGLVLLAVLAGAPPAAADTPAVDCADPRTPQEIIECRGADAGDEPAPDNGDERTPTPPAARTDEPDAPSDRDDEGFPVVEAVVALLAGAALGFGGAHLLRTTARPLPSPSAPPAPGTRISNDGTAARERAQLVAHLVDLRDRVGSDALADEIRVRLEAVGVTEIPVALGDVFDPNLHHGVDARPTDDPSLDQRVAAVDRPGYRDGATVVRLPDVVVYRRP